MSNEPTGAVHELRRLVVSILGTVIMAWIAVKLVVSIWEPLLAIVISITVIAVFLRWWRWHR
ncbi:hypothetical protein [Acidithrix ferrooxidans]|uniref:Uncharacterized protein n=1 Tax=Acidithrix ferrooxidans TaxID=1280514 RepID=A0A0D8HJQ8_9ACTN|nr:hypothetical protein [Acidithrix ferrooxidans]KJF18183.1 hypothetical protein AXFE_09280 [Acidithrix ferrooxidans]